MRRHSDFTCVAVIPARGGSKGIPRKNARLLGGKPLVAHSVDCARSAQYVDRVVVSTDDAEIAAIAEQHGGEVVWRPAQISGDKASSEAALLHTLDHLREEEGYTPDLIVFLQCTSPLTLPEDIDGAVQVLLDEEADSALAVTPNYHFLWRQDQGRNAAGINHDKRVRPLRQEREPQFLETGAVYVMRAEGFRQARHRFFGKTVLYVMPRDRVLEIDDPIDFHIAEVLMRQRQQQQKAQLLPKPVGALVLDFDGVFTDNLVVVFEDGREAVLCNRGDGWGLARLKELSIPILVISTERNPVVRARCNKLGIECMYGIDDKLSALKGWLEDHGVPASSTVFVGNDVNDVPCMQVVGCSVAVADAYPEVKAYATVVLSKPGGKGAVREIVELIKRRKEEAR